MEDYPLQFIYPTLEGKLEINNETANILCKLNCPIKVIAVAGNYRTGKSYLLNRIFSQQNGFEIGPTVQACTKGLWIWGRPSETEDVVTILLDTEGLGDPNQTNNNHDPTIFALSILLSSFFVFNSLGAINEASIQQMNLVLNLTKCLKTKEGPDDETGEGFDRQFPPLLWVARDFSLLLQDPQGKPITENQYLESQLELKKGYTVQIQNYNLVRGCIRGYFKNRALLTLPAPTTPEKMGSLSTMQISELNPSFNAKMEQLVEYVLENAPNKTMSMIEGETTKVYTLNGTTFVALAYEYVTAINDGKVPVIPTLWQGVTQIENQKALKDAFEQYTKKIELASSAAWNVGKALERDVLETEHTSAFAEAISCFTSRAIGDLETVVVPIQNDLRQRIAEYDDNGILINGKYFEVTMKNNEMSLQWSAHVLHDLHEAHIAPKLQARAYLPPKGQVQQYEKDRDNILDTYDGIPTGPMKQQAKEEFLKNLEGELSHLLSLDTVMTAHEKQEALLRQQNAEEKAAREKQEEAAKALHQQMLDSENAHKVQIQALEDKTKIDMENFTMANNKLLADKLAEQEKLMKQGFADQAKLLDEERQLLQKERDATAKQQTDLFSKLTESMAETNKAMMELINNPPKPAESHHHHNSGCFSLASYVSVFEKGEKRRKKVGELRVGDNVEVVEKGGKVEVSEIYWIEKHEKEIVKMVELCVSHNEDKFTLVLTPEHLVYASKLNKSSPFDCDPIEAAQIEKGFFVWVNANQGKVTKGIVTSVRTFVGMGMINIFTLANNILVDDVLASCHIVHHKWQVFDALLIRMAYKISPTFSSSSGFQSAVKLWDEIFEDKLTSLVKFISKH